MFVIGGGHLKDKLVELFNQIKDSADIKLDKIQSYLDLSSEIAKLREERNNLTIDISKSNEKYEKREREIEHKLGLERLRQEQELKLGLREGLIKLAEANLAEDRKRFEEQMKFNREQMEGQIKYLKDLISPLLEALPKMTIKENVTKRR